MTPLDQLLSFSPCSSQDALAVRLAAVENFMIFPSHAALGAFIERTVQEHPPEYAPLVLEEVLRRYGGSKAHTPELVLLCAVTSATVMDMLMKNVDRAAFAVRALWQLVSPTTKADFAAAPRVLAEMFPPQDKLAAELLEGARATGNGRGVEYMLAYRLAISPPAPTPAHVIVSLPATETLSILVCPVIIALLPESEYCTYRGRVLDQVDYTMEDAQAGDNLIERLLAVPETGGATTTGAESFLALFAGVPPAVAAAASQMYAIDVRAYVRRWLPVESYLTPLLGPPLLRDPADNDGDDCAVDSLCGYFGCRAMTCVCFLEVSELDEIPEVNDTHLTTAAWFVDECLHCGLAIAEAGSAWRYPLPDLWIGCYCSRACVEACQEELEPDSVVYPVAGRADAPDSGEWERAMAARYVSPDALRALKARLDYAETLMTRFGVLMRIL